MSTPYSITLSMSASDATALSNAGAFLCAVKQVQASKGACPVVWFSTPNYSETTTVNWTEQYGVFCTAQYQIPNGMLGTENSDPTNLGQLWEITNANTGILTQDTTDPAPPTTALAIYNNSSSSAFSVGMSQSCVNSAGQTVMNPICAYNILAGFDLMVAPIEKVLLYFDTNLVNTGTVITQAFSNGILIDLTSNANQTANYSLAGQWTGNVGAQYTLVSAPNVVSTMVQTFPPAMQVA